MAMMGGSDLAHRLLGRLGRRQVGARFSRDMFDRLDHDDGPSSTTMPIASTSASSENGVEARSPAASMTAKVPISATGTATIGMIVARRLPRKTKTTIEDQHEGPRSGVWITLSIVASTNTVRVVHDVVGDVVGEARLEFLQRLAHALCGCLSALAPGSW